MTTLQEQFEKDFPDKGVRRINVYDRYDVDEFTNRDLDLSEYKDLEELSYKSNGILTSIKLPQNGKLKELFLTINWLTQIDLSQCKELEVLDLRIYKLREWFLSKRQLELLDLSKNKPHPIDLSQNNKIKHFKLTKSEAIQIDLSECGELEVLNLTNDNLTSVDLSELKELRQLRLGVNNLTSVDFLNQLPNSKKLEVLEIYDNNIQPITLDFLRPFVNLKDCKLGENSSSPFSILEKLPKKELKQRLKAKTYNKFYGSLEPIKNLTKLEQFCIAGTDVEEGIEYIPTKIAESSKGKGERAMDLNLIDCQPLREDAKVAKIQNELRAFDYDISAWQLAHPEKMLIARPELFTNPDSKDKWIQALKNKLEESKKELSETDREKVKKITRLESKISELEQTKQTISQQTQTEFSTQDQGTQTDLTLEQINKWEQKDNKKTLYQKIIEKFKK